MKKALLAVTFLCAFSARAATVNNDDSCDIAVLPAATLLLPYFEVDLEETPRTTTLFTIVNTTNLDRIAHVTLWTDRGYPVFGFDVYLTGYDVQGINLHDVFARGVIAPEAGTGTAVPASRRQRYADVDPDLDLSRCARLPGPIDEELRERIRGVFTTGILLLPLGSGTGCNHAGNAHYTASGYATIDLVGSCATSITNPVYWARDLRHDNVLTGDYEQIDSVNGVVRGEPLVHIRSIPETGTEDAATQLTHTFYERFTKNDRRQPLPSRFAARFSSPEKEFVIWRQGNTASTCFEYEANRSLAVVENVVFDEDENAVGANGVSALPLASSVPIASVSANGGWVYLNLDDGLDPAAPRQAWVTNAVAMGNGCSVPVGRSEITGYGTPIQPSVKNNDDSCDVSLAPAATLLVPYFEVDLENPDAAHPTFSVTNASNRDRIARVTLWTDYAVPVLSFNVFLTGYDVQKIDLYEVLAHGVIASNANAARGTFSHPNRLLDASACEAPQPLPAEMLAQLRDAFVEGIVPGCFNAGDIHDHAIGYATVDVVRNCASRMPTEARYWTDDIAYDNVLIGDAADGAPPVHIRAIPNAPFARTFYARYQPAGTPRLDARQPLPSRFVARWFGGHWAPEYRTQFRVWRQGLRGTDATCATNDDNVMIVPEIVAFDEAENCIAAIPIGPTPTQPLPLTLPATSSRDVTNDDVFPQFPNGATAGWMYFNLDNRSGAPASSNWVTLLMSGGPYAIELTATALGNGCSAPQPESEIGLGSYVIGPSPDVSP